MKCKLHRNVDKLGKNKHEAMVFNLTFNIISVSVAVSFFVEENHRYEVLSIGKPRASPLLSYGISRSCHERRLCFT